MIDWGILAFFVIQLALTFAIYHAYTLVKAEKSVYTTEIARTTEVTVRIGGLVERMDTLEKAPGERVARVQALEDREALAAKLIASLGTKIEAVDRKVDSVNGRIAAKAKAAKRAAAEGDDELDPDPQGEEVEIAQAPYSPGSFRRVETPVTSGIPSGFGVVRRNGSHG